MNYYISYISLNLLVLQKPHPKEISIPSVGREGEGGMDILQELLNVDFFVCFAMACNIHNYIRGTQTSEVKKHVNTDLIKRERE